MTPQEAWKFMSLGGECWGNHPTLPHYQKYRIWSDGLEVLSGAGWELSTLTFNNFFYWIRWEPADWEGKDEGVPWDAHLKEEPDPQPGQVKRWNDEKGVEEWVDPPEWITKIIERIEKLENLTGNLVVVGGLEGRNQYEIADRIEKLESCLKPYESLEFPAENRVRKLEQDLEGHRKSPHVYNSGIWNCIGRLERAMKVIGIFIKLEGFSEGRD